MFKLECHVSCDGINVWHGRGDLRSRGCTVVRGSTLHRCGNSIPDDSSDEAGVLLKTSLRLALSGACLVKQLKQTPETSYDRCTSVIRLDIAERWNREHTKNERKP